MRFLDCVGHVDEGSDAISYEFELKLLILGEIFKK